MSRVSTVGVWLALALGLGVLWTCAGDPPETTSAQDLKVTVLPTIGEGTHFQLQWTGRGASSYTVESRAAGRGNPVEFSVAVETPFYIWRSVPLGQHEIVVRPEPPGIPTNHVLALSIDPRHFAEALLLGSGPYQWRSGVARDRVWGWNPGSSIEFVIDQSLPPDLISRMQGVVGQVEAATHHRVVARWRLAPGPLPAPGQGQVTVEGLSDADLLAACERQWSCGRAWMRGPSFLRGRIFVGRSSQSHWDPLCARAVGVMLGLVYIHVPSGGTEPIFVMDVNHGGYPPPDELDPATVQLLDLVYARGWTAGTTRRQLESDGVVARSGSPTRLSRSADDGLGEAAAADEEVEVQCLPTGCAPDQREP